MRRSRPLLLPRTPLQLVAIASLIALSWCWDAAVRAWTATPSAVTATLQADPRLLRPDDLPAAAIATLLSRPVADTLATELLGASSPADRAVAAWVVARRIDAETQLVLYLNTVPMGQWGGREVRGLDEAAIAFFGKRVAELHDAELDALVAMTAVERPVSPTVPVASGVSPALAHGRL